MLDASHVKNHSSVEAPALEDHVGLRGQGGEAVAVLPPALVRDVLLPADGPGPGLSLGVGQDHHLTLLQVAAGRHPAPVILQPGAPGSGHTSRLGSGPAH